VIPAPCVQTESLLPPCPMPSGRTHDRITLWTLPLVAGLSLVLTQQGIMTLLICAGFLLGGLMLGPDLDTHSIHYKRWGWFRWIWLPYRSSMRHRSLWSHSPLLGTTVRVIYLMTWMGMFSLVGVAAVNEIGQFGLSWMGIGQFWGFLLQRFRYEAILLFIGLELGAFSHYTADWIVSHSKRGRSPRRKSISAHPKSKTKRRKAPRQR
jgi:uncharacterized metal-binding protein